MTLAEVLAPIRVEEFQRSYLGQRYVVVKGGRGRFQSLLSWHELNEGLSRVRVNDGRVALVKNTQRIAPETYVQSSQSGKSQYLIGPAVTRHVLDGATLIVNQVDELFPEIRRLAESCEELFQVYVSGNLYAGWRRDKGFDVHWDSHDTLIVQVMGCKDWKVWRPTREHPIGGDGRDVAPPPTDDPIWEGTLEDGDTLYMPRGWWHVACPRNEPSVHVTFGVSHRTGVDLLSWMIERAKASVNVRMDIPHWKSVEERRAWLQAVRDACVSALDDDVVERYMSDLGSRAHSRPIVRLPETVSPAGAPTLDDQASLRLCRGRRLHLVPRSTGGISFVADGREWQCHEGLTPALAMLHQLDPCTLTDMRRRVAEKAKPLLRPFVTALLAAGVVWAEPVPEHRTSEIAEGHHVEA